jgi:hypothetical protein
MTADINHGNIFWDVLNIVEFGNVYVSWNLVKF